MNERKEGGIGKKHRHNFRAYIDSTCITCISAKALINTAFLGPLPGSTSHNVSHRSCIPHCAFHERRCTHQSVLKSLYPLNISINDD